MLMCLLQAEIPFPADKAGLLFGKDGATIKLLKRKSRAVVFIDVKAGVVRLQGTASQTRTAEELIKEILVRVKHVCDFSVCVCVCVFCPFPLYMCVYRSLMLIMRAVCCCCCLGASSQAAPRAAFATQDKRWHRSCLPGRHANARSRSH